MFVPSTRMMWLKRRRQSWSLWGSVTMTTSVLQTFSVSPNNYLAATHGSFVVFWLCQQFPPILCAVAYAGRTGPHNLAAAGGIAVTLGIVSTNALPNVRVYTYQLYLRHQNFMMHRSRIPQTCRDAPPKRPSIRHS